MATFDCDQSEFTDLYDLNNLKYIENESFERVLVTEEVNLVQKVQQYNPQIQEKVIMSFRKNKHKYEVQEAEFGSILAQAILENVQETVEYIYIYQNVNYLGKVSALKTNYQSYSNLKHAELSYGILSDDLIEYTCLDQLIFKNKNARLTLKAVVKDKLLIVTENKSTCIEFRPNYKDKLKSMIDLKMPNILDLRLNFHEYPINININDKQILDEAYCDCEENYEVKLKLNKDVRSIEIKIRNQDEDIQKLRRFFIRKFSCLLQIKL